MTYALDIDLCRGNADCELSCPQFLGAIGEPFRQLDDFVCQVRIGKNRDSQSMPHGVPCDAPLSLRRAWPGALPCVAAIGGGEATAGQTEASAGRAGRDDTTGNPASSMPEVARRSWAANTER